MFYEGRVYRPPSEARSLIIQATIGCAHNDCTFCSMYKGEAFRIKSLKEILEDMAVARNAYSYVDKIFIADGDSMSMKTDDIRKILDGAKIIFPEVKKMSMYATTQSLLRKSVEELRLLREHGLEMVYLGIESGSAEILRRIKKGVKPEEIIEAGKKVMEAGIELSVTLISGLGSEELSHEHAVESAKLLNALQPDYIGLLTLLLEPNAPLYKDVASGKFRYLEPREVLEETKVMVEHLNLDKGVFRSNHASNYVPLRGTFPQDKEKILADIERGFKVDDRYYKSKYRGL